MTATAIATTQAAPVALVEPRMSQRLAFAVRDVLNPTEGMAGQLPAIPDHARLEAVACIPLLERMLAPAGPDRVRRWLLAINAGCRQPLSPDEFAIRGAAIAGHCADLPALAFTAVTQREGMSAFPWFPAAADVEKLLLPHAAPLRAKLRALRALAEAPAERVTAPPTEAEREVIAAQLRTLRREIEARAMRDDPPPRPAASYATGEHLAAIRAARVGRLGSSR